MEMNGGELVLDVDRFEGADFLLDMELSVTRKKRLRGRAICEAEKGGIDVNYVSFLDDLHAVWDAKLDEEGEEEEDEEKEEDDPDYSAFFGNLKVHGNAYMCDVSLKNGVLSPIIYEEESNSADKIKRRTARMSIGSIVQQKRKLIHDDDMKFVRKDAVAKNDSGGKLKRRRIDAVGDRKCHMKNMDSRSGHPVGMKGRKRDLSSSVNGCSRENRSLGVNADKKSGSKCSDLGKKSPVIDENYGIFIDHLHVEGKHGLCEYRDHNNQIYFESSNPQKTNVEVVDVDLELEAPSKIDNDEEEAYWRELHHHLRKPYDQEEYDDLLELLCTRKPVYIHRESRSGGSYRLGHAGKSYLDLYPDLNCEIEKVKSDHNKVLNLLRMCKIYVQKIPSLQSGHTRPWMDEFSKSILPGSSDGY